MKNRKSVLTGVMLCTLGLGVSAGFAAKRPNIIYLMSDD
jgi:hypothetical protein